MDPATLVAVWLIKIVVAVGGKPYYGDPESAKYRKGYPTEQACKRAAAPLAAVVRPQHNLFYEVKGVTCREHKIEVK